MIGRHETSETQGQSRLKGFDDFDLRLGDIMRGERATLGKSLLDVQRELKIKATYIAAIENTDPSAFETPGFIAGYVRSYARYLGLDPEWAYKTFCEEGDFATAHGMSAEASGVKPGAKPKAPVAGKTRPGGRDPFTDPSVSFVPKAERATFSGIEPAAIGSMLVLVALVAGIGYGGWSVLKEIQKVQFTPVDQAPGVVADVAELGDMSSFEVAEAEPTEAPVASIEAFDRLYRPEALEVPVLTERDGPIAALDPSQYGVLVPDPLPEVAEAAEPFGPPMPAGFVPGENPVQVVEVPEPEVVLFAVRPAWVRVQSADGTVIFEKILEPGERFTVPLTEEPARLRAGNAGSVYFAVNGETYGPAGSSAAVVKQVALAPQPLKDSYALADPEQDADLARFVALAEAAEAPAAQ